MMGIMAGLTCIDLFAGAGGMSAGFSSVGFEPLFANECDSEAARTYTLNHPSTVINSQDICDLEPHSIREDLGLLPEDVDVLIGGPPCQGFSTYGARDVNDPRSLLPSEYLRFLVAFRPKAFVMENVVGLVSIQGGRILEHIVSSAEKAGYTTKVFTLNAADFGVPQTRRRVFVTGILGRGVPVHPSVTHKKPTSAEVPKQASFADVLGPGLPAWTTTRDAIGSLADVPVRQPKETQQADTYPSGMVERRYEQYIRDESERLLHHSSKRMLGIRRLRLSLLRPGDYGAKLESRIRKGGLSASAINEILEGGGATRPIDECRLEDRQKEKKLREHLSRGKLDLEELLKQLDPGGFKNKYRRLEWTRPSHTLVAHMARDCSDFVHPDKDRFISVREAARLQSFKDTYRFSGSQFRQFKQIGNAVPPMLAAALARELKSNLNLGDQ